MDAYGEELNDQNISRIFEGAADFMRRELSCGELRVYAYGIDGLIASSQASDFIYKPIAKGLYGASME